MKNFFKLVIILTPIYSLGAIPKQSHSSKAREILQLPFENQKSLLSNQPERIYRDFVRMAFDKNSDMRLRWKALMAAAHMKKKEALPDLLRATKDSTWFMKNAGLAALAEYHPEQSLRVAKELIKDKALVVRSAAVEVLARAQDSENRHVLWKELRETRNYRNKSSLWIRPQIVEALAQKPLDEETELFAKLLQEKELEMQIWGVRGLEKLTGMKLGSRKTPPTDLVKMWKNHEVIN